MIHFDSTTYSIGDNKSGISPGALIEAKPMLLKEWFFVLDYRFVKNGKLFDPKKIDSKETPSFLGYFSPHKKELLVREIRRGIIAEGQNFASRMLGNLVVGFERAGHEVKAVIFDAVFRNIDGLTLSYSPLLKALNKVGYRKIKVVEIKYTPTYYQLIGERSDSASCEYALLSKKN